MSTPNADAPRNLLRYAGQNYQFTPVYVRSRDPTIYDIKDPRNQGYYPYSSFWINSTNNNLWALVRISKTATWIMLGSGSSGINLLLTGDDSVGVSPVLVSGLLNLNGSVVNNGTHAKAVFTESPGVNSENIDVQVSTAIAATDRTKVGLAAFDSASFMVDINGWVQLVAVSNPSVQQVTVDGAVSIVPAGSPANITLTGNTVNNATHSKALFINKANANAATADIQVSTALVAADRAKVGLAAFNNTEFTVDGDGFVSLLGGAPAIEQFTVDAATAPGTNPVVPASGIVTITGNQVGTGVIGAHVIRTNSLAANTYTIEIQRSTAVAATDSTKNGVSHFNSAQFSVDSSGFVTLTATGLKWNVINQGTQPANFVVNNGYICQAGGTGLVSIALPTTSVLGDTIEIVLDGATSWTITMGVAQRVRVGGSQTSLGGTIVTTGTGDAIRLVCETANTKWVAAGGFIGNLTIA